MSKQQKLWLFIFFTFLLLSGGRQQAMATDDTLWTNMKYTPNSFAFSPDDSLLAIFNKEQRINIIRSETGIVDTTLNLPNNYSGYFP